MNNFLKYKCKFLIQSVNVTSRAVGEKIKDAPQNGGAYTLCELRRFLGGATHSASLHEALAEQSALGSLVRGTDSLALDYVASVSNQLS